ncbi:hypothetical protein M885DRAFT_509920 [Pelagophyceae sp. CCMP2097]|nr:hypothetical protein M885DRAFT_509920 [Pelagophyceae sp. CCMP2097]
MRALHDSLTACDLRAAAAALRLRTDADAGAVHAAVGARASALLRRGPVARVSPSATHGLGVFAAEALPRGSVVGLFPGYVVEPGFPRRLHAIKQRFTLAWRAAAALLAEPGADGLSLDKDGSNSYALFDACLLYDPVGFPPAKLGPCGVCHRVNHPPRGVAPQVLLRACAVDAGLAVPNDVSAPLAMVLLQDVDEGDELFMDYRYEVAMTRDEASKWCPEWYCAVEAPPGRPVWRNEDDPG